MRSISLLFIILLSGNVLIAQGYYNKWYFGYNAGLDFNTDPPTPISGKLSTEEGCASICDAAGNLLFYTDGESVWNANHELMPDGTGLNGRGTPTQSAIIIPLPGSLNQYYIFTSPGIPNPELKASYSIADMSEDNGLGDIIQKNIPLPNKTTERITAVRKFGDENFWIIIREHNNPVFYSYRISAGGVDLQPVVSNVGISDLSTDQGYLKASHRGNKLALATSSICTIEIFDFDNKTGSICNPIKIKIPKEYTYGLEFSPDDSKLYFATWESQNSSIYQVNLKNDHPDSIINSVTCIANNNNTVTGALQLGPDGKIYAALYNSMFLGVINNPDSTGVSCNYINKQITLQNKVLWGLPNFCAPVYCTHAEFFHRTDTSLCEGEILTMNMSTDEAIYHWQDGSTNPIYTITQSGVYWVRITTPCEVLTDTIVVKSIAFPEVYLGNDTVLCTGDSLVMNAFNTDASYLWQDYSKNPSFTAFNTGHYWVRVKREQCVTRDSVYLEFISPPQLDLGADTILCYGKSIILDATNKHSAYLWQDNSTTSSYKVQERGIYRVTVSNKCGSASDTISVDYTDCECFIQVPNAFTPNIDGLNDQFIPISNCLFTDFRFKIFNRWGEQIFESSDPALGWDGKYKDRLAPVGVFYYSIRYKFEGSSAKETSGDFTLIR